MSSCLWNQLGDVVDLLSLGRLSGVWTVCFSLAPSLNVQTGKHGSSFQRRFYSLTLTGGGEEDCA